MQFTSRCDIWETSENFRCGVDQKFWGEEKGMGKQPGCDKWMVRPLLCVYFTYFPYRIFENHMARIHVYSILLGFWPCNIEYYCRFSILHGLLPESPMQSIMKWVSMQLAQSKELRAANARGESALKAAAARRKEWPVTVGAPVLVTAVLEVQLHWIRKYN